MTETLGQRIAKARNRKGLERQQDLADLVAKGRTATISEWENDQKAPGYESLVALTEAGLVASGEVDIVT